MSFHFKVHSKIQRPRCKRKLCFFFFFCCEIFTSLCRSFHFQKELPAVHRCDKSKSPVVLKFILRPITKGNVDSCKIDRQHIYDTVPSVLDALRSRARRNQGLWPNPILRRFWWLFQNQSGTTGSRKVAPRDSSEMEGQGLRWTIIDVSYIDLISWLSPRLLVRDCKYVCGQLVCYAFSYCTNSSLHNFMCSREKIMKGNYDFYNNF